jgi:hypothetical protein
MVDNEKAVPGQEPLGEYTEASLLQEMSEWRTHNPTTPAHFFDNFSAKLDRDMTWLPEEMRSNMITSSVGRQFIHYQTLFQGGDFSLNLLNL